MPRVADGRRQHSAYRAWVGMRQRCNDTNASSWPRYGGRGIRVDPEWDDFWKFAEHLGEKPQDGQRWTLDRIDNEGNYEPGNVRWATYSQQNRNRGKLKYRVPEKCSKGHEYVPVKDSSGNTRCSQCVKEHNRERSLASWEKRRRSDPVQ